jgi:membrane protein required for colicin V production
MGFYLGYLKGIIKTVFDSLSFIVAILAALKLTPLLIAVVEEITGFPEAVCYIIGVLITFASIFLLVRFIGNRLEAILESIHLNIVNKILGGLLQALFFCYMLSLVIWAIGKAGAISESTKKASVTYPFVSTLPEKGKSMIQGLKPIFIDFWDATVKALDSIGNSKDVNDVQNGKESL